MKKILMLVLTLCLLCSRLAMAEDAPLRVTASFYPLYIATINVAKDVPGLDIRCLAPPAAGCLHDYQMTTDDRKALEDSDVIIYNGAGLEAFLDKLLPTLNAGLIEASQGIALLEDEHSVNPHVWVSPDGMIAEVNTIAAKLGEFDPAHQAQYAANAAAYTAKLEALRDEMKETLAPLAGEPVITFHEAFDYFAEDFGLRITATVHNHDEAAPSARQMAELSDTVRSENVKALFAEPQYEDASVDILSKETGVPVYILDPAVSGEVNPEDYDAYLRIMRQNMDTLVEALQ